MKTEIEDSLFSLKDEQNIPLSLEDIDQILDRKQPFDRELFKEAVGPATAEQLYVNQKVSDLISNAEMEQSDYRRSGKLNVFFGEEKRYLWMKVNVFVFNTIVLIGSTLGCWPSSRGGSSYRRSGCLTRRSGPSASGPASGSISSITGPR